MYREMNDWEKANFRSRWDKGMKTILREDKPSVTEDISSYPSISSPALSENKEEVKNMNAEKIITYRGIQKIEGIGELKIELSIDDDLDLILEKDAALLSGYAQLVINSIIEKHEMG